MHTTRDIATDLITPLGAYLRLRPHAPAAFLLESVERGRLGRHSLVGCGAQLSSFEDAESSGEPVVGYLAYGYAAELEPPVPLPDERTGRPRRPPDVSVGTRAVSRSAAGEPVALPVPARARRPRVDRLVARDARQGRRQAREPESDRGNNRARARRCRAAAHVREGSGRARDARRPRAERP